MKWTDSMVTILYLDLIRSEQKTSRMFLLDLEGHCSDLIWSWQTQKQTKAK